MLAQVDDLCAAKIMIALCDGRYCVGLSIQWADAPPAVSVPHRLRRDLEAVLGPQPGPVELVQTLTLIRGIKPQ